MVCFFFIILNFSPFLGKVKLYLLWREHEFFEKIFFYFYLPRFQTLVFHFFRTSKKYFQVSIWPTCRTLFLQAVFWKKSQMCRFSTEVEISNIQTFFRASCGSNQKNFYLLCRKHAFFEEIFYPLYPNRDFQLLLFTFLFCSSETCI